MSNSETFFNKNFGVLITAIVSLCAVIVSASQIWVATINKNKELEIAQQAAKAARELEILNSTRDWNLDVAKFMAQHREAIFSEGEEGLHLQKVMLATFPPEITASVFGNLSKISNKDSFNYWISAEHEANKLIYPRVKIFHESGFPYDIINLIGDTIAEGEIAYDYQDQEVPEGLTGGDVRYFHPEDKDLAVRVQNDFEELACFTGYRLKLKIIPLTSSKKRAPSGTG